MVYFNRDKNVPHPVPGRGVLATGPCPQQAYAQSAQGGREGKERGRRGRMGEEDEGERREEKKREREVTRQL